MNNYKIFISHSSAQKRFVDELSLLIGRDYTYVDMYDFEAGSQLEDEIKKHIESCCIFVLLLSEEAIGSAWVKQEVAKARIMLMDNDLHAFVPFIVDQRISHDDPRLQEKPWKWILGHLLKNINSPQLAARIVKRLLKEKICSDYPQIHQRAKLFIGRDKEMSDLLQGLYSNISNEKRAVIVSGLSHIGRKRLLKEFLLRVSNGVHDYYEPVRILLTESDGVESLVEQLNELLGCYDRRVLLDMIKDGKQCQRLAVAMLNSVADRQERLFIRDERCVVQGSGRLKDWFVTLLKQKELKPMIHFYIASQCTPSQFVDQQFHEIICRQITVLDRPSMRALFNAYAKLRKIAPGENDIKDFLSKLDGHPQQVYDIVDNIEKHGLREAKKLMNVVTNKYNSELSAVVSELEHIQHATDILMQFAKFEFVTSDLLQEVCPDVIDESLDAFHTFGLYETFGSTNEYMRLSPAMAIYVRRSKIPQKPEYVKRFKTVIKQKLANMDAALTDLANELFAVKELLRDPNTEAKVKERYLIPQFVLKVIVEEYNNKHDDNVINLVEMLINDSVDDRWDEIGRNIRFWYCCSLCRKKSSKFLKEVGYFKESGFSYNFLRGFYERHHCKDELAEEYYREAIKFSGESSGRDFVSKAQHELVLVMMNQEHYIEALPYAERNYRNDKDNPYHIEAYFRCMVRMAYPDKDTLTELIKRMEKSYTKDKIHMLVSMKALYECFVVHDFKTAVEISKRYLEDNHNAIVDRTLREICKQYDTMGTYYSIKKELKNKE